MCVGGVDNLYGIHGADIYDRLRTMAWVRRFFFAFSALPSLALLAEICSLASITMGNRVKG